MKMSLVGRVITLTFCQMINSDISIPSWFDLSDAISVDSVHSTGLTDREAEALD